MSSELPASAVNLLKSTRFVHLATCINNFPHVSLMNYTYYNDSKHDYIIISTPKNTTKYENITKNPNVSLLVHDWVTAKPEDISITTNERRNSLYELLTNLNKNEISRVSVMLTGIAETIEGSSDFDEKYNFYKTLHLNSNQEGKVFIDGDNNAIILIKVTGCKITDTDNNVEEY